MEKLIELYFRGRDFLFDQFSNPFYKETDVYTT